MNEYLILGLIYGGTLLFISLVQFFIQRFSRKPYLLGVSVNEELLKSWQAKNIVNKYKKSTLIFAIVLSLLQVVFSYFIESIGILTILFFISIILLLYPLIVANGDLKKLKNQLNIKEERKIVISTDLSKEKISGNLDLILLYGLSLFIIIIGGLYLHFNYDKFPDQLAMHVDFSGNISRYEPKTYLNLQMATISSFSIWLIMTLVVTMYLKSKQRISPQMKEESLYNLLKARKIWTWFMGLLTLAFVILFQFGIPYFMATGNSTIVGIATVLLSIIAIGGSIFLGLKLGIDGSKLGGDLDQVSETSDENWYLGGTLYYNPDDPAIFVYKRVGVGMTLNLATIIGIIITIVLIILIITISLLLVFLTEI